MTYYYKTGIIVPFIQKFYKQMIVVVAALFIASMGAMTLSASAANTTTEITGDTATWLFNRDAKTSTPFEFNNDQSSIGNGSLYVLPIANDYSGTACTSTSGPGCDKFIAENFIQTPVSSLDSISYDFLIAGNGNSGDANEFYLNIYANIDSSSNYYDCRFDYVPATGSTSSFTTASFSATDTPVNVQQRGTRIGPAGSCPTTLAGMPSGSHVYFYSISLGDTTTSDTGLAGYFDNVVVETTTDSFTYDFEPASTTPYTKDECKKGGWVSFNTPVFKNQGQCVAFVASGGKNIK